MEDHVLVLGCGSMGRRRVRDLQELGIDDILVYDARPSRSAAVAAELGVRALKSPSEGYEAGPKAVLVCTPTSLHLPLAAEAIRSGCDVLVEKPLSRDLDGVDDLLGDAERGGRVLMVGYSLRFHPCVRRARDWLEEGKIGHVVSARLHVGSYLPARHPWEDYRTGYAAITELGGGVLLDAIHEIDLALWLFGSPEHAYAVIGRYSRLEIDTEDVVELLLSYRDRRILSVHLDYVQRPHRRWFELTGEEGSIVCDLVARTVKVFDASSDAWHTFEAPDDAEQDYLREIKHFLDCLSGQERPPVDGATARQSLALAVAARVSADRGERVLLAPYLARPLPTVEEPR
jgi:predicted dehydrogenase